MAEVLQLTHCALRAADAWTVAPMEKPADQFARLSALATPVDEGE